MSINLLTTMEFFLADWVGHEHNSATAPHLLYKCRNRKIKMTASKLSTEVLPRAQGNGEWLQITPGERFKIHTSVEETERGVCDA